MAAGMESPQRGLSRIVLGFIAMIGAALSNNATGAVDNQSCRHLPKLIWRARRDQQL
jgi:hypothetical protein